MARLDSVLDTVGGTPSIRLNRLAPEGVEVYVKAESFNPLGSVKDRLALGVIEDAERRGALKPGQTVVEATSGNTGIGLAMVCAAKGYPLVVTMAENFSVERRKPDAFPRREGGAHPGRGCAGTGMLAKAVELAERARLVPHPPVRERGQRRLSTRPYHRAGRDPGRLRRTSGWTTG